MQGAKLHTLGFVDLSDRLEDGVFDGECKPKSTRKKMVADILSWQKQSGASASACQNRSWNSQAARNGVRMQATPMRQSRDTCGKCGWVPKGAPSSSSVCACSFLEMDPFHPVATVLGLAQLRDQPGVRTNSAILTMTIKGAGSPATSSIELRMSKLGAPHSHVWPHCVSVAVNDTEVARVEPPKTGQKRRADAPIRIEPVTSSHDWSLEVRAELEPGQWSSEFVLCVVRLAPAYPLSSLLTDCLAQPVMTPAEARKLWDQLHGCADSAVECATPLLQPLVCPLTRERMQQPARGVACQHLRCFDLQAYLETSARAVFHRRWRCPVCDLPLPPKQLIICGLTTALLEQADAGIAAMPLEPALQQHSQLAPGSSQDSPHPLRGRAESTAAGCMQQPEGHPAGSPAAAPDHVQPPSLQAMPGVVGVKRRRHCRRETLGISTVSSGGEVALCKASWGRRLNAGPSAVLDL